MLNLKSKPSRLARCQDRWWLCAIAGLFFLQARPAQADFYPPIPPRFKPVAEKIVADRTAQPLDNIAGTIAWGVSYELDSFIEMYGATGDESYLDLFVKLAEPVLAARADVAGERDWEGKLRKGWLTGAHYTIGVPTVLLDKNGQPALEVQTIARAGNNSVTIEAVPAADGKTFSLIVTSGFRQPKPQVKRFEGLTMENVEANINPKPGELAPIAVKRLGAEIPRVYAPFTPPTGKVVLHGHHTGQIVAPLARFAALVQNEPKLHRFSAAAKRYLQSSEEAIADMQGEWREKDDYGYFIFQKGIPFWSDGVPEPLNTLAATGTAYLFLFDATKNPQYRNRAAKLARLVQRELQPQPDGTVLYHYWWGIVRTGWKPEDNISHYTPAYGGQDVVEDQSHFQLSLRFIIEGYKRGIVFSRDDLQALAKTFHQKLLQHSPDGKLSLSDRLDGKGENKGKYNYAVPGWAQMGFIDPAIPAACRAIYEVNFTPINSRSITLYGWAALAGAAAAPHPRPLSPTGRGEE